jgi:hypothetical protein
MPPAVTAMAIIIIIPPVMTMLVSPAVIAPVDTGFPFNVWLPVPLHLHICESFPENSR